MPRPVSTAPDDRSLSASDSDSDDLFGSRRRAAEEAALLARRSRLLASSKSSQAPSSVPRVPSGIRARPAKRARTRDSKRVFDLFGDDVPPPPIAGPSLQAGSDAAIEAGGYARLRPGDVLDGGRYVVESFVGQGVFASVFRCREVSTGVTVAIKVSRANVAMRRAATHELSVLRMVHSADTSGRSCVVSVLHDFVHRSLHSAIVFEYLDTSLRMIIRQHVGGVRLAAVRMYAAQTLRALALLSRIGVVHGDMKPDNVLLSADRIRIRVADFGCAVRKEEAGDVCNAYLAARFYRAPETILGLVAEPAVDVWATGCVLYELYTGEVAFPGGCNNEMMEMFLDKRGAMPMRMLRRGRFRLKHFDEYNRFLKREKDPVSGKEIIRKMPRYSIGGGKSNAIRERIVTAAENDDEKGNVTLFADLIDAMLVLDPTKRITAADALRMPLFQVAVNDETRKKTSASKRDNSKSKE